ncbi:hypothetical protein MLD38_006881 [Melastoma candidum]|uniref:Uncharacterized protein n=1 Tax=Melastoma candidum TaxID=119954 RepID=A0ACB9RPV0_9MYRT|nr:hypothetical protein MLD38_006881 [Melastoma candidum]
MGNKIARTKQGSASEYYLHDLPSSYNLVLKEVLGKGRFFKTIQCKHDEGLVLVKVYFKRDDAIDLREYERRLLHIKETFRAIDHPHVWPFQSWQETDKAAYLLRQYFFNNLHDRLSTRPFLSIVEKKWLAFQLLLAVKQCHEKGICHGDIKCENVLVTSWNWLYLADFASFKPTYIPYDDPSDFSFFFDTGGRRLCYLAPERFYEHEGGMQVAQDAPLKPSMDIFAVGCVIAELFLEGQPLFELSQLLAYRRGQYDPIPHLERVPDAGIRKMILHMIQLEPEARLSAESYLQGYAGIVFPGYFSPPLHNLYCCCSPLAPDARVAMCQSVFNEILKHMMIHKSAEGDLSASGIRHDLAVGMSGKHDDILTKNLSKDCSRLLLANSNPRNAKTDNVSAKSILSSVESFAGQQGTSYAFRGNSHSLKRIRMDDLNAAISEYDSQLDTFGMPFLAVPENSIRCEGMVLIASLLCACIRNVKLPHLRRGALVLLASCSLYIDDEDRLQRVLPYVVAMLSDPAAIVRSAALETLCYILILVRDFPPSDAKIFPEYILPMLSMLPDDSEESVRICYASNIAKLALTAHRFLMHSISLSQAGVLDELSSTPKSHASTGQTTKQPHTSSMGSQLILLRKSIAEIVQELVMGPKQTPCIRRALLLDIGVLCCFFGQRHSNDFLLPILPAFLNDRDEQLRAVFYGQIIFVCFFVGQRSVEEYLLPYIEQALNDATEAVIVNALDCLTILCRGGFLRKRTLLGMIERALPLFCYPSQWVRRLAISFIATSSENLGAVDSFVFLAPLIRPYLRRQPASLASEKVLLSCLKPPVSKQEFYHDFENGRSLDMLERQRKIWYNPSNQSGNLQSLGKSVNSTPNHEIRSHLDGTLNHIRLVETDNREVKSSLQGSYQPRASSLIETPTSEKLQFFSTMSSHLNSVNSFMYDRPPEGIPLYSFSVDKRVGNYVAASASSLQLNSLEIDSSSLPCLDSVSKSFSLASSVPAPKLVSGSFSISNGSKQFYRVVHEPEGKESDQGTIVRNNFQDLSLSGNTKTSTVSMEDASTLTDAVGIPAFARSSNLPDSSWRPRGVLVAHLQEHRSAVNDVAVSTDHSFFVSASDDHTVKVWDSRKLEKDISFRSRLTYHLEDRRALCAAIFRNTAQVVVGACDGTIHVFSVDYISRGLGSVVEKYSGIADVKKKETKKGAILSLLNHCPDNNSGQMVMYSSQNGGIHLWDVRNSENAWSLENKAEEGYVSSIVAGSCGNWFVSGSSRGVLTLWDLRFLIPVNSWQYSSVCPIETMCLFVPPVNASPSIAARHLVYVAAGANEISLWNVENSSCHQVMRAASLDGDAESSDVPWALMKPSSKVNSRIDLRRNVDPKYRVEELNEPPPRLPGSRALLPLPGGDLLTGGTDLKIRRWDHVSPDRTYCMCGPTIKGIANDEFYEARSLFGVQVVQETRRRPLTTKLTAKSILAAAAADSAGCHRDSILSLASVKLNQRLLISSSRDGAIKVWK